ncbi:10591_t:CDS:10 [Entrophospora sp. SA101]|nr:8345_t:CDS:10 [Entrophospora sp. SA101]CAJ0649149.1 10591_t:CDS:10 [Entrophospora sp. SA101]CAJ0831199.1 15343_t:CDS:10 [Entrophospora sp. SA101]CAJ0885013.1 1919_t:CDS:10 [Entrophospora sp. SA101]
MNFSNEKTLFHLATLDYQRQKEVSPSYVADLLTKANNLLNRIAFAYSIIDKPQEGQIYLILLSPNEEVIPPDGYHYLEPEATHKVSLPDGREMIVMEKRHGFASNDQITSIIRRRYFFVNNHNNLQILHYSILPEQYRQMVNINFPRQAIQNSRYPIHQMQGGNIAPYFLRTPNAIPSMSIQSLPANMMPGQSPNMQRMLGDNASMQTNTYGFQGHLMPNQQAYNASTPTKSETDEPSGDELDGLKFREVAMLRYKRNHDFISEIFSPYSVHSIKPPSSPYESVNIDDLRKKLVETQAELDKMNSEHAEKIKNFKQQSSKLTKAFNDIKNCNTIEELNKVEESSKEELDLIIETYDPVRLVELYPEHRPDSELNHQTVLMQEEIINESSLLSSSVPHNIE